MSEFPWKNPVEEQLARRVPPFTSSSNKISSTRDVTALFARYVRAGYFLSNFLYVASFNQCDGHG